LTLAPDRLVAGETAPQVLTGQAAAASDRDQFTPLFCASFCTVALNTCEAPVCTVDMEGVTATTIAGGGAAGAEIVIVAVEDFVPSVTEVAVNVTVGGVGAAAGAPYMMVAPDAPEIAPQVEPLQPWPDNAHVTPLFWVSLLTAAVKLCD
jgi:hypothetical protein